VEVVMPAASMGVPFSFSQRTMNLILPPRNDRGGRYEQSMQTGVDSCFRYSIIDLGQAS
jgi:hypothetical protein